MIFPLSCVIIISGTMPNVVVTKPSIIAIKPLLLITVMEKEQTARTRAYDGLLDHNTCCSAIREVLPQSRRPWSSASISPFPRRERPRAVTPRAADRRYPQRLRQDADLRQQPRQLCGQGGDADSCVGFADPQTRDPESQGFGPVGFLTLRGGIPGPI